MNIAQIMTAQPVTVRRGTTLDRAMELMDEHDIRHLPVLADGHFQGVISNRDVLDATGWLAPRQREVLEVPEACVSSIMHNPNTAVGPGDPVTDALSPFVEGRVGCVPVVQGGDLVGLVTEIDVLRAYTDACRLGSIGPDEDPRIGEHLVLGPVTVEADTSGMEAAQLMRLNDVRHLPVVEGDRVIGMLSDRDICRVRGRGQLELTLVREMMSPDPQIADPEMRLSSAALILSAERISALPVVSEGHLLGITTTVDLMIPCALALQKL